MKPRPAIPPDVRAANFARWFGASKVVDDAGRPLVVYHGTRRPDRIGTRLLRSRATSGPMPFFTDSPALASSYSSNKSDTSLERPDTLADEFTIRLPGIRTPLPIVRAWWFLSGPERERLARDLPRVSNLDDAGYPLPGWDAGDPATAFRLDAASVGPVGIDTWRYELGQAKGNWIHAAAAVWLDSGLLYDDPGLFASVLELAGLPGAVWHDPHAEFPGVLPVFLSIHNPLDARAIPADVVDALRAAGRRAKAPARRIGADQWDKRARTPSVWLSALEDDVAQGTTLAWTSIPDWVTRTLERLGFDGIRDVSGKHGGERLAVWIPFRPDQVKAAYGNAGTYRTGRGATLVNPRPSP